MNVFKWVADKFRGKRHDDRFPREVKKHWYCGAWYLYLSDLREAGEYSGTSLDPDFIESPAIDRIAFNPFRTGHAAKDETGLFDGLIPAIRVGDEVGLYKQVGLKFRKSAFYDGAPWDDGFLINLEFVKTISIEEHRKWKS